VGASHHTVKKPFSEYLQGEKKKKTVGASTPKSWGGKFKKKRGRTSAQQQTKRGGRVFLSNEGGEGGWDWE